MSKVVDLESEIDREIDRLIDTKRDIEALLEGVKSPAQLRVLHLRYFGVYDKEERRQRYPSFAEIGDMMGYSERQVCNIHGIALLRVNELLRERAGV
jgi:DNA-directed RNA polymerase specialized sigma subunit